MRAYVQGAQITFYRYHASLRWLVSISDPSGRLTRWILRLSEFNVIVKCTRGLGHKRANALSLLETFGKTDIKNRRRDTAFVLRSTTHRETPMLSWRRRFPLVGFPNLKKRTDTEPSEPLERVSKEEIVREQYSDTSSKAIRSLLYEERHYCSDSTSERFRCEQWRFKINL